MDLESFCWGSLTIIPPLHPDNLICRCKDLVDKLVGVATQTKKARKRKRDEFDLMLRMANVQKLLALMKEMRKNRPDVMPPAETKRVCPPSPSPCICPTVCPPVCVYTMPSVCPNPCQQTTVYCLPWTYAVYESQRICIGSRNREVVLEDPETLRPRDELQVLPLFQPNLSRGNHRDRVLSCFMIHSSLAIGRFPKLPGEILWARRGLGERFVRVQPNRRVTWSRVEGRGCVFLDFLELLIPFTGIDARMGSKKEFSSSAYVSPFVYHRCAWNVG